MSEATAQSMDNALATNTNAGLNEVTHDQRTVNQQNNAQQNEILQTILELRRQQVAQFEQRARESDQLFTSLMSQVLNNQAAAVQQQATLAGQQQSYTHQEAAQSAANTLAMQYAALGIVTIIP